MVLQGDRIAFQEENLSKDVVKVKQGNMKKNPLRAWYFRRPSSLPSSQCETSTTQYSHPEAPET